MSAQRLGARKVRQLERRFGLRFDAVWSFGDHTWVHARTVAHRHVDLNRRTGERVIYRDDEVGPGRRIAHFDSCPDEAETAQLRGGRPAWEVDVYVEPTADRGRDAFSAGPGMGRPAGVAKVASGDPRPISRVRRDKVSRYL